MMETFQQILALFLFCAACYGVYRFALWFKDIRDAREIKDGKGGGGSTDGGNHK